MPLCIARTYNDRQELCSARRARHPPNRLGGARYAGTLELFFRQRVGLVEETGVQFHRSLIGIFRRGGWGVSLGVKNLETQSGTEVPQRRSEEPIAANVAERNPPR